MTASELWLQAFAVITNVGSWHIAVGACCGAIIITRPVKEFVLRAIVSASNPPGDTASKRRLTTD
jgi:hypothetical protein